MKRLGRSLLIVSALYTSYYIGRVNGYVKGALVTCKAFIESKKKDNNVDLVKEAQEENNGQGSGN